MDRLRQDDLDRARRTPVEERARQTLEMMATGIRRAEELLAMKVLSMTQRRLQDRIDAVNLVLMNEDLDLDAVRENLAEITRRGFHREQDLLAKLTVVLEDAASH